jgi:hypothetical protein
VLLDSLAVLLELAKREEARMLTDEHHAVNTMIDRGAAFDQIEDYIDTLVLPGGQLSALWLLAWAKTADLPRGERWRRKRSPLPASPDTGACSGPTAASWPFGASVKSRTAQPERRSGRSCGPGRAACVAL